MQTVSLEKYEAKDILTRIQIPYMRLTRQIFDHVFNKIIMHIFSQ